MMQGSEMFDESGCLSRTFLLGRGCCCGNGCRNCPYEFTGPVSGQARVPDRVNVGSPRDRLGENNRESAAE
ncbi:MAG: DUF5522 domain-containing protein [Capsulimonadaceae bacterium]